MAERDRDFKIDLVYMWVDGNDSEWKRIKSEWEAKLNLKVSNDNNDSRFIDNEELRFSLRSVEKNVPWINKIFIVTNGQIPKWLDTSNNKIQIVTHSEIMPADSLPTFNSCAIEACIANIPDLSEHFILANDDCFFYRPVKPGFFFTREGKPIVRLIKRKPNFKKLRSSLYLRTIMYSKRLIQKKYNKTLHYIPHHNADAYSKKAYLACIEELKDDFNKVIYSKFRNRSVQRVIISYYMLINKLCKLDRIKPNKGYIHMNSLCLNLMDFNELKHIIGKHSPYLLCLNDEPWVQPMIRNNFKNFLTELYPKASSFERKEDFKIKPYDTNKEVIVFSVSNNFADIFSVALESMLENLQTLDYPDIVILDHKIVTSKKMLLEKMIKKFAGVNVRFINIDNYLTEKTNFLKIKSKSIYEDDFIDKLLIPFLFSDYEKVLYLDSDVCINSNIMEIFQLDLQNKPLTAVRDTISPILKILPDKFEYVVKKLGLRFPEKYFNTGVLLFDITKFDLDNYYNKLVEAAQKTAFKFPSQDILNIIFNEEINLIHPKWNYINSIFASGRNYFNFITKEEKNEYVEAVEDIKIIHYTSIVKPWLVKFLDNCEIFWKYAKNSLFYETILSSYNNKNKLYKYTRIKPSINVKYYSYELLSLLFFKNNQKIETKAQFYRKIFLKLKYIRENL